MKTIDEIQQQINDTNKFTVEYWEEMLARAESETHKDVIRDIITNRERFVLKLYELLHETRLEEDLITTPTKEIN